MTTAAEWIAARPAVEPMTRAECDAIHDDIRDAYLRDHARVTEFLAAALACLATIAQTGTEADNVLAANHLRHIQLAAKSGIPMYEPQEEVL